MPVHAAGGFDHADVFEHTGRVFVAHTANGTVEVVDGVEGKHLNTIVDCPEASGVLCAQKEDKVFAAARGTGDILVIDSRSSIVLARFKAGSRPNGLAWDIQRKHLLVADVGDNKARIVDAFGDKQVASIVDLPGRPRWSVYDQANDKFLVNIRDPPLLAEIDAEPSHGINTIPISVPGPHGLALDEGGPTAFVACDGKELVSVDLRSRRETARVSLSGEPDVIWLNQRKNVVYCSSSDPGAIDVIDASGMKLLETVKTDFGSHTSAFDQQRQRLYALLPASCSVSIYEDV